jgi:hypothetical protein
MLASSGQFMIDGERGSQIGSEVDQKAWFRPPEGPAGVKRSETQRWLVRATWTLQFRN